MPANEILAVINELANTKTDLLWTIAVSAIVSTGISYWFKRSEIRHKAEVDYEYEQRKRLREVIGRYHGRLLSAANSMNYRLWNLYANHDKGWLDIHGDYEGAGYYFLSSAYRFLNVCTLIRQLETEAVLLDARIAEKKDFAFLNYAAALHWVMTDVALFRGLPYDNFHQRDHFFSDHFRHYSDLCIRDGNFLDFEDFKDNFCGSDKLNAVLLYFDELKPNENRFRWDRLVAFHLLLMAFINAFGYKRQHSGKQHFFDAAKQIRNPVVLENLVAWIPKHDLADNREAKKIIQALGAVRKPV